MKGITKDVASYVKEKNHKCIYIFMSCLKTHYAFNNNITLTKLFRFMLW